MPLDRALFDRVKNGDLSARDEAFNANTGLIWASVKRFTGLLEKDDLFQLGAMGLLKAIDRFDPSYGVEFSTFAFPHILGEVRRYLRDNTPLKVERRLKEIAFSARKASASMKARSGVDPPATEIASLLGVSVDLILSALDATRAPAYLEDLPSWDDVRTTPAEREPDRIAESLDLRSAIEGLDPMERAVIEIRFFGGRSQSEAALRIGVSQAQVSRLEKRALLELGRSLGGRHGVSLFPRGDTTHGEEVTR